MISNMAYRNMLAFLAIAMIFAGKAVGQDVVHGIVVDESDNEPLPGVSVVLRDSLNKICSYASTDISGNFNLSKKPKGTTIEFSLVGYAKQSIKLQNFRDGSTISLRQSTELLKNVNVTANQIREQGDTITYLVATFAKEQDASIGDVIKRMPGLEVDKSGKIQYQGADINRFYIEGADMLGGRYGVATNGISASDIGAVEVMENHQPLQVLSGIAYSDQAAINLKLRSGAKSTWLGNGGAGGGFSLHPFHGLWEGHLFTMAAMPRFQTLMTYKTNNTGNDISGEISDFIYSARNTGIDSYFTPGHPAKAIFGNSREWFNVSHMLSLNQLWKLSNKYSIKTQIDYLYNREHSASESTNTYFLDGGDVSVVENQSGRSKENILNGLIAITANERTFYLDNTLRTNIRWNRAYFATTGTDNNTQSVSQADFYIDNTFSLIRRIRGNRLVRIDSRTEWESRPQSLDVSRTDLFGQKLRTHAFYNEEKSSFRFQSKGWGFTVEGGLKMYLNTLNAQMTNGVMDNGDFHTRRNYFTVYLSPQVQKTFGRTMLELSSPVSYAFYSFGGYLSVKNACLFSPSMTFRWNASQNFGFAVSGSVGNSAPAMDSFYPGVIASDYRVFNEGLYLFRMSTRQRLSANARYRNTSKGLFANAMAMISWSEHPYTRSRYIQGDNILYGYVENKSSGRMLSINWNISKTVKPIRGGFSVSGMFTRNWSTVLSQSQRTRSHVDMLTVNAKIYSSPCRFLYLQYKLKFNYSALHYIMSDKTADMVNSMQITVYPCRKVYVDFYGELYSNGMLAGTRTNVPMLDAKITYKLSSVLELKATATNLLNRDAYTATSYGLLSTTTITTAIRGREFMLSLTFKK